MENTFLQEDESCTEHAQHIGGLISKYIRQQLTPALHNELETWVAESEAHMKIFEQLTDEKEIQEGINWVSDTNKIKMLKKLKRKLHFKRPRFRFVFWQYAV
jgi:hypothetical protein